MNPPYYIYDATHKRYLVEHARDPVRWSEHVQYALAFATLSAAHAAMSKWPEWVSCFCTVTTLGEQEMSSPTDAVRGFARRLQLVLAANLGRPATPDDLAQVQAACDSLAAEYRAQRAGLFERVAVVLQALEAGTVQVALEPESLETAVDLALRLDHAEQRRLAWVCERNALPDQPQHYLTVAHPGVFAWTPELGQALRLARREDAEAVAAMVADCWRVSEHEWSAVR